MKMVLDVPDELLRQCYFEANYSPNRGLDRVWSVSFDNNTSDAWDRVRGEGHGATIADALRAAIADAVSEL